MCSSVLFNLQCERVQRVGRAGWFDKCLFLTNVAVRASVISYVAYRVNIASELVGRCVALF